MTARISKSIKANTQFQALAAVLGDDQKALAAFNRINPEPEAEPVVDARVQKLLDAGLTAEEAATALADVETVLEAPVTEKEKAEALMVERGFTWAKGRVYATPALAEAIIRVHRGAKAQVVPSSGVGRTKAVLVYKEASGDVVLQNLTKSEKEN